MPGTEPVSLPSGAYPGTCRDLSAAARAEREASGRPAALRLRADDVVVTIDDLVVGAWRGRVDDFVIRRGDGVASYNLAVAVDDVDEGVEEVIRGDDLLASTPRQLVVLDALGRPAPTYGHVPLVLGPSGERLAKRDGAVTLEDLAARGQDAAAVLGRLAASLGLAQPGEPVSPATLLDRFDLASLPRDPWVLSPADC